MEAAQVATSAEAFQQAATSVMALLADTVAAVLKAALLACHHVLRGALAVLAQQVGFRLCMRCLGCRLLLVNLWFLLPAPAAWGCTSTEGC
jgi:small-conductance mechanosensitive channel